MKNVTISRRQFVKASAAVAGSFTFDNVLPGSALGANSRIRIGVISYQNHPRLDYLGLQDHGSDCWFKNLKLLPRKEPKL